MAHYQYQGTHYELPDGLSNEQAIGKIKSHLDKEKQPVTNQEEGGVLSKFGKAVFDKPMSIVPGVAEALTGGVVSMGEEAVAGIAGLGTAIAGKDFESGYKSTKESLKPIEKLMAPETDVGKATSGLLGKIPEAIHGAGETVFEKTGSPLAGATTEAALTGATFMLGKGKGKETPVNPEVAAIVEPKETPTFPAASYPGIDKVRHEEQLKVAEKLTGDATQQKKIEQARQVLEKYPEVQAATTGKQAAIRKRLEKYMADPDVMAHIKTVQDTKTAFEEATVPDKLALKIGKEQKFLSDLKEQGADAEQIKMAQADVDAAIAKVQFKGVPREEAQGWIDDMKSRQKEADNHVIKQETLPKTVESSIAEGKRLSIKDPIFKWDYRGKADQRLIMQNTNKILEIAPDEVRQKELTAGLEDPKRSMEPAVKETRKLFDDVWNTANKEGVVKDWVENYVTHMYDYGSQSKSAAMNNFKRVVSEMNIAPTSGMGTKSRFGDKRIFKTYDEAAQKAGLKPYTTNPAELYQIYAGSMLKATNNKKFIAEIKEVTNPATGEKLIKNYSAKTGMPKGYESINHPQFAGKAVAKDIAPTIRSMFENPSNSMILNGMHLLSMIAKKGIFSFSAFHIKSLGDALIGALRNPKQVMQLPSLFKEWKEGGAGDIIDLALKGGLEIGHAPIDVHADVLAGVATDVSRSLDRVFPHLGDTVRLPAKAVEGLNKFLWEYVHPSFKLLVWSVEHTNLVAKGVEPLRASEMAATAANDLFGGLNFRRIAENTNSYLGYRIANEAASKGGQRAMQIALLAPDWTIATLRSWEGAFRKGADPRERAIYQKYLLQSALIYAGVADLLNVHFTGHHFWQNEDPTMVDMGDGRKLQLSKHFMETPHWFLHPNQTLLNKLGYVPSETFRQALNADYLSATGASPRISEKGTGHVQDTINRALHMVKGITPITLQTTATKSTGEAIASGLGFPVYGDTPEKKAERKQIRQQKMLEIRRKMNE